MTSGTTCHAPSCLLVSLSGRCSLTDNSRSLRLQKTMMAHCMTNKAWKKEFGKKLLEEEKQGLAKVPLHSSPSPAAHHSPAHRYELSPATDVLLGRGITYLVVHLQQALTSTPSCFATGAHFTTIFLELLSPNFHTQSLQCTL